MGIPMQPTLLFQLSFNIFQLFEQILNFFRHSKVELSEISANKKIQRFLSSVPPNIWKQANILILSNVRRLMAPDHQGLMVNTNLAAEKTKLIWVHLLK